jgi:hypothetical protein
MGHPASFRVPLITKSDAPLATLNAILFSIAANAALATSFFKELNADTASSERGNVFLLRQDYLFRKCRYPPAIMGQHA